MIKAILEALHSRRDIYGNVYWSFRYTDVPTGRQVEGKICGGESNIAAMVRELGLTWEECHYTVKEFPIREYDRMIKEWQYAGCPPEALVAFVNHKLATWNDSNAEVAS